MAMFGMASRTNTMAFARILAFTLLAATPVLSLATDASAATPAAEASDAKLSIKATVEHDGAKLDASSVSKLGETAKLHAADDAHAHDLTLTVVSKADGGYSVKVGYARDGKSILKSKTIEVSGGELTLEAKGSKITVSFAPSIHSKPKRSRIDVPEGDDPLAGL